ncbi:MAG: Abi family protein [Spirochaetaceae bacterium]|nr:Abi family protein [Spirochaetaceae bacterium]
MKDLKKPTTIDEQINILKERGLLSYEESENELREFLSYTNYYRLGYYLYPFWDNNVKGKFRKGINFRIIKEIYSFDQKLRSLLFEATAIIEIALRRQIVYSLCLSGESHPKTGIDKIAGLDIVEVAYQKFMKNQYEKTHEVIKRCAKYNECGAKKCTECDIKDIEIPPLWATIEVLTMGDICKICKSLISNKTTINNIINAFNLKIKPKDFQKIIYYLRDIRNRCAHNEYVWIFKNSEIAMVTIISFIFKFMAGINNGNSWINDVYKLLDQISLLKLPLKNVYEFMGFGKEWLETLPEFKKYLDIEFKSFLSVPPNPPLANLRQTD